LGTRTFAAVTVAVALAVIGAGNAWASGPVYHFYAGASRADTTPPLAGTPEAQQANDQFARGFSACPSAGFPARGRFALQEPFQDQNGDNQWDPGTDLNSGPDGKQPDPFCDANGNGRWDGLYADNEKGPATGIHDPLDVRAVAVWDGRHQPLVYASVDAIGIFDYYTDLARSDLLHDFGVHASLVVSADHNESSPDTIGLYGALGTPLGVGVRSGIDEFYMRLLEFRIAQAAASTPTRSRARSRLASRAPPIRC
jgi:hypothetical protein